MQILLANAKIMFGKTDRKPLSTPLFQTTADMLAAEMAKMNMEDLARQLDCSKKIATENWIRYQNFVVAEKMPALLAYNGQAYKPCCHLERRGFRIRSETSLDYMLSLRITPSHGCRRTLSHGTLRLSRNHKR